MLAAEENSQENQSLTVEVSCKLNLGCHYWGDFHYFNQGQSEYPSSLVKCDRMQALHL